MRPFLKHAVSFFLLFICCLYHLSAQTENGDYKTVVERFKNFYNKSQFDSIYNMYDEAMQNFMPLDKTTSFFKLSKDAGGQITNMEFEKNESGWAFYKTKFQRALKYIKISANAKQKITGIAIIPYGLPDTLPKMERNSTLLKLPFKGEWTVIWGGDTKELNYHVISRAQKNAFDICITDKANKTYKGDGKHNEDYYAYGKEIIAPCDAEVVLVTDGVEENVPHVESTTSVAGNNIILKTANNEFLFFAHFKPYSLKVEVGQKVKQGDVLGLCGNSGHSTEPHLHFHIQNVKDIELATGVKCYFDKIWVDGKIKTDYSPIKGDHVKNVGK